MTNYEKFYQKYINKPGKTKVSKGFEKSRSLHGAQIIRFVDEKDCENVASLYTFRAKSEIIIDSIDEQGNEGVLVGNCLAEIVEKGVVNYYFYLRGENRELKITSDEEISEEKNKEKSLLYKLDISSTMQNDKLLAKAVSLEDTDNYNVTCRIINELHHAQPEIE